MTQGHVIGIDIGASRIKGGVVDTAGGRVRAQRRQIDTPFPATPAAVAAAVAAMVANWSCAGPVGITLPCTVKGGVARSAVNIPESWIGVDAVQLMSEALHGRPVVVANDADAAGVAELHHGAARGHDGTVVMLTFGTGIGSALLVGGRLVPNTEFGQMLLDGWVAEQVASAQARQAHQLSWPDWCARVGSLLRAVEETVRPDLVVIGGGVSHAADRWRKLLPSWVVPAALRNSAGLIGAAVLAADCAGGTVTAGTAWRYNAPESGRAPTPDNDGRAAARGPRMAAAVG